MDEKELKQYVVNELKDMLTIVPKDLNPDDLVPEDIKQKLKERTNKLIQNVRDA